MNNRPTTEKPKRLPTLLTALLTLLALAACVWGALALSSQAQRQWAPTVADTARLQAQADNVRFWAVAGRIGLGMLFAAGVVAGVILAIGGALAAVKWLERKAITIEARNGLYPLLRDCHNRFINPNLSPTPIIDLDAPAHFVGADQVSSAQMQITTQAQVIQVEAAQASGITNLRASVNHRRADGRGQQPIVILERELPPVRYAPGSQLAEVIEHDPVSDERRTE